jgi:hypothetical protein
VAAVDKVVVAVWDEYHLNDALVTLDAVALSDAVLPVQMVTPLAVIVAAVASGLTVILTEPVYTVPQSFL